MRKLSLMVAISCLSSIAAAKLSFTTKSFDKKINEHCHYDIHIPVLQLSKNKEKFGHLNSMFKSEAINLIAEFDAFTLGRSNEQEACSQNMFANKIQYNFELKMTRGSPLVSLMFFKSTYTGGSHSMEVHSFLTLNSETGERYESIASFIEPSKLLELKRVVESKLIEKKVDLSFGWLGEGGVKGSWQKMTDIKNFYIQDRKIVMVFNPYEVSSYADGAREVILSKEELGNIGLADTDAVRILME